jgi:hypothetical protein
LDRTSVTFLVTASATMTSERPITRRQEQLIRELREVDADLARLRSRRANIMRELDRIYPEARKELTPPPKDPGIVIGPWNFERHGYTARLTITAKGRKAIRENDATLRQIDTMVLSLALTRENGVDLSKLMRVEQIKTVEGHKKRLDVLAQRGYINIEYVK